MSSSVEWSDNSHLLLNVGKMKEMVVKLRRKRTETTPITIKGKHLDLGVYLNDRLEKTLVVPRLGFHLKSKY